MSSAGPSDAPHPGSDASSLTSKERLLGRIKQNFDLETQRCRQRDHNSTGEGESAQDEASQVKDQLRRLKRRCAKLERKLQEKEEEILSLQDQQQLRFPLLMHETMRSLRSLEDNQSDRTTSASPLAHSVISDMAHERRDVDARIHEYEQQIAELYEENQQEKLKNEMLSECLRDQKHAKAKLMKVCKQVKQELQAVKDSGLSQMLMDIEARCDALEREKTKIEADLSAERSLRAQQETQKEVLSKQLDDLIVESSKWEDIVARKDKKLQQSRDQICEQQLMIENLKADLKIAGKKICRPAEHRQDDDREELEQLKCTISAQRERLEEAQISIRQVTAENSFLREQLTSQQGDFLRVDADACAAEATYDKLLMQLRFIKNRLRALKELVQTYEETNTVNINLLDEGNWFHEDSTGGGPSAGRSCEGYAVQLSGSVLDVARCLAELQQVVEDVCARLMGSTCALQ
ncbi:hypothetical protein PF005_g137 [Phytophthora fragariae]|uniref:Uncharacterized protein n=1 Tax=Phytophthora fragariae TaxID=53985 RepID=A0A6A3TSK8_9STRA|nr:hypothetical protein PF003_g20178 [Phytophthora fragariae]KAE8950296.1 hypothetical protein PF009_g136 [Phytophthora fragariae]KAE9021191.1 hypothetical protein PF011_g5045 [Phytophthora fragariae]KAE9140492.1 hypothetical protein PF010_g131 [Phytophthora fragariae]KAE9141489.1 hypothetical protein PF007_g136 [Phytophthora fragariae]